MGKYLSLLNDKPLKKGWYIYKISKGNNILFIGKTKDIIRIGAYYQLRHFDVQYIKCSNEVNCYLLEIFFANKYKPKYNMETIEFKEYYSDDLDSDIYLKQNIKWKDFIIEINNPIE